jgi:purine-binding chemotaxis protein CheW
MAGSTGRIQQLQEEIARRAEQPSAGPEEALTTLLFSLAGERCALPLNVVREVSRVGVITPLPGLPPAVLGATGLRGEVLPVLDLRRLLDLEEKPPTVDSRLLIVRHGTVTAALLVDGVEDIAGFPGEALLPPPTDASGGAPAFLQGLVRQGKRTIYLLDLARLLEAVRHGR